MQKPVRSQSKVIARDSPEENENTRGARARAALIAAAVEVFSEHSVNTASTRDIAKRAAQNVAAISYHFGSKQGLYLAVMHHVAQVIERRLGPMMERATLFLDTGSYPPAECLHHISNLLEVSVSNSSDEEMVTLSGIIVREQTHVTAAFDVLYDGILGKLHRTGERLMSAYITGVADTPGYSIHYHALLSQSLGFRLARATVMRSSGWKTIGSAEESRIRTVVLQQAALVLNGLRAEHLKAKAPASSGKGVAGKAGPRKKKSL